MLTEEDTSLNEYGLVGYNSTGLFKIKVIPNTRKIGLDLSTNTSSWNIGELVGQTILQLNVYYWIKVEFTGSAYNIYLSTDGNTYNLEKSLSSTTAAVFPSITMIGYAYAHGWNGSIDLSESYIKINNEIWWQPNIVQTYDYDWIFTKDENWTYTGLTKLGKKGEVLIPEHNIYQLNQSKMKWEGLKQLTFNIIDEDEFYTNVIEN